MQYISKYQYIETIVLAGQERIPQSIFMAPNVANAWNIFYTCVRISRMVHLAFLVVLLLSFFAHFERYKS